MAKTPPPDPRVPRIASDLIAWFASSTKDYPWRKTRDPYAILVSEIMLQQTQIATVLDRGYFTRWLECFPDFASLATAPEEAVLKAWEGLGYYRRARNLQKLAQQIVADHHGVMPADPDVIRSLPGIGPYTAGAISSFAFNLPEPIVDGNVARVVSRVWSDPTPIDSTEGTRLLWERATNLVRASENPSAFNSALMELGQTVCRPGNPDCDACPIQAHCRAETPEALPVRKPRPKLTAVTERVIFVRNPKGVLLERETGNRRTGLWKLPALPESSPDSLPPVLLKMTYGITRYRVTLWVHEDTPDSTPNWPKTHQVIPHAQLDEVAMPSPYRKALKKLLQHSEFRFE